MSCSSQSHDAITPSSRDAGRGTLAAVACFRNGGLSLVCAECVRADSTHKCDDDASSLVRFLLVVYYSIDMFPSLREPLASNLKKKMRLSGRNGCRRDSSFVPFPRNRPNTMRHHTIDSNWNCSMRQRVRDRVRTVRCERNKFGNKWTRRRERIFITTF